MKTILKCAKCNTNYEIYEGWQKLEVNAGAIGLCKQCIITKDYSTKNSTIKKGDNKKSNEYFTFSYELEGRILNDGYLVLCNELNGFIPTLDCSVDIELKSPIYKSLNGLKKTLWTASNCIDLTNYKCGQHIHIGHSTKINSYTMNYIRRFYHSLFVPLCERMQENENEYITFFGRPFNNYANSINMNTLLEKMLFINVQKDNTIEFRLCKFNNVNQYYYLSEFGKDIIQTIINNFIEYIQDYEGGYISKEKFKHKARLAGNKIVKVYEKYIAGQAHCQRESRNNKQW
jgi:hypothetical protein